MISGKSNFLFFRRNILKWNELDNNREMPWKGEADAYKIWLSEIILQQTRVNQGLEYYKKFIKAFPNVHVLAKSSEEKVYKLWEGLGYYNRCKNLIETAKYISQNLDGQFPNTYESILHLKGVGEYTASAIASFAFKLPYAVVDGNVYRVLARFFGINKSFNSSKEKIFYKNLAQQLLDNKKPGIYNQAIMDFGATVCTPQNPKCNDCILKKECVAFKFTKQESLPVKKAKLKNKNVFFSYAVFYFKEKMAIKKRTGNNIWNNLYEFYLLPIESEFSKTELQHKVVEIFPDINNSQISVSEKFHQKLTHLNVQSVFLKINLKKQIKLPKEYKWVSKQELNQFSFPKIIRNYLLEY
jgi:A/G-specific adenine glycosylase